MTTKKMYTGALAFSFVLVMAAMSLVPIFEGAVPKAEAASSGSGSVMPMYAWGTWSPPPTHTPTRVGTDYWIFATTASGGRFAINHEGYLHSLSTSSLNPTRLGSANNWVQVSARSSNVVALNSEGRIFQGTALTPVGTDSNWVSVIGGNQHGFAINEHGELFSWGSNTDLLGRGATSEFPANLPGRVGERSDWVSVAAGASMIVGVTEDGTLYSWGTPANIGRDTDTVPNNRPGKVGDATNWISAMTTNGSTAAINEDGELWTWGAGAELGRSPSVANPAHRPGKVLGTADNWVSLHGGNAHFLAFNESSELWGWGSNGSGQLGLGDTSARAVPTLVLQTYGFSSASRGGGSTSIMLLRTTPAEGESLLTKSLQMPEGTPIPSLDFEFTFTPKS
ncbi:MAG: hypothetical protein FWE26_02120, partial [Coriobacteriia bacterium]|nr:hypothetical protein [Coriobacteriia bacterium]